ncbi:hypothetical protein [Maritimibacter dapengensis]|uniref:Uncharacterized protein n=1 Tax=Maritimibacter dapengensis TaxID=2836868 RepID=A0ABS6SXU9_9RHOB|nr:hypothetical protein [Maritimibacter dapengensis]MBV7377550.1 hypothetical protein [Maritimibacter dapengensis]
MTIKAVLIGLAGMVAGWVAVLVLVGLLSDAAPAQVVILPSARLIENLPPDVAIMDSARFSVTLESDSPALARRLYASGARLVLPAGLPGCLPLPETAR